MPSLEGRLSANRQLLLPIAVLASRDPSDISFVDAVALIDTGATSSGIGPKIVEKLRLKSHQKKPLSVATELRLVDYYLFRIGFVDGDAVSQNSLPYIFTETDGFSWLEQKSFDVILGMDVISQCDLHVMRNGSWQLSFG